MKNNIRMITEGGVMLALASILSQIKIYELPQGGSITLGSMIPIFIFALRWGYKSGLIVGALYGFIQMLLGGSIFSPLQAIIDYPLAFASLGIAGLANFKDSSFVKIILSIIFAGLLRTFFHVLSGVVFFYEYAGDQNPLMYSLSYNGSFMLVELIMAIVIIRIIYKPLKKVF